MAGFIGVRERPVAADMDQDGIDDIGLWVPDRSGATPEETSEWYFLISDDQYGEQRLTGTVNTLDHHFKPIPFGKDMYAQFGDEYALPLLGNFDPPVTPSIGDQTTTDTLQLSMKLVQTPTTTSPFNGDLATLPDSQAQIDEWGNHWVEIWASVSDSGSNDTVTASFNLTYDAEYFTAADIEFGTAFDQDQSGTIDTESGMVEALGATASWENVADGRHVLLARVRFEPVESGSGVPLVADGNYPQPVDNGIGLSNLQASAALTPSVGTEPDTKFLPMMYDINDNGQIGLGDLAFFASSYGENVAASSNPYAAIADFDHDGVVGLGDLALFASVYQQKRTVDSPATSQTTAHEEVMATQPSFLDESSDAEENPALLASLYQANVNYARHSELTKGEDSEENAVDQIMLYYGNDE